MSECFHNVVVETTAHLLPSRLANVKEGVQSLLSSMLMRYNSQVGGVVMSYDKLKILDTHSAMFNDSPYLHFDIQVRLLVFRPVVGSYIVGIVNKVEGDHIGVLVNGIFNASVIASTGLPSEYEYHYSTNSWINSATSEHITIGTKLRLQISKLLHFLQVISMECDMRVEDTGIVN